MYIFCKEIWFWKKGSDENKKCLFRGYFLKETNFNEIDLESIKEVTLEINYKHKKYWTEILH